MGISAVYVCLFVRIRLFVCPFDGVRYLSASEMTYIVSGGALNSTHSLSSILCAQRRGCFAAFKTKRQNVRRYFIAHARRHAAFFDFVFCRFLVAVSFQSRTAPIFLTGKFVQLYSAKQRQ